MERRGKFQIWSGTKELPELLGRLNVLKKWEAQGYTWVEAVSDMFDPVLLTKPAPEYRIIVETYVANEDHVVKKGVEPKIERRYKAERIT